MLKLMTRMTAAVGLLAILPSISNLQRNVDHIAQTVPHGEAGNPSGDDALVTLGLLEGRANPNSTLSLTGLLGLLEGASIGPLQAKPAPPRPATLIYSTGRTSSRGKSEGTAVMELPPGASAMMVDGRLQVYHPHGTPKTAH